MKTLDEIRKSVQSRFAKESVEIAVMDDFNAIIDHLQAIERKLGMAGAGLKCTCVSGLVGEDCPLHSVFSRLKPDLPLNARVATALGYKPIMIANNSWGIITKDGRHDYLPPYDKHVDLAMGALEEYCRKNDVAWRVEGCCLNNRPDWGGYFIKIRHAGQRYEDRTYNLPQAICEAIAKHAEGRTIG